MGAMEIFLSVWLETFAAKLIRIGIKITSLSFGASGNFESLAYGHRWAALRVWMEHRNRLTTNRTSLSHFERRQVL